MRTNILAVIVTVVALGCGGGGDDFLGDADGNTYVLRDMPDGRTWG
jgi:hypothetical protein